ncbi:MAG TPA: YqgE/AlgH family protein [Solirubrobacteraceae bacterium]
MDSIRGQLLIAGPGLLDPNFFRTVVLVVEHSQEGALGLILNRPSETTVREAAAEIEGLVGPDQLIYVGGPVQPSSLIILAEFEDPSQAALVAFDDVGVLAGGADEAPPEISRSRAFVGHSGWGAGQLEAELEREDWFLVPATRSDAFSTDPLELWEHVLIRKGGRYALVARMPPDPSVN